MGKPGSRSESDGLSSSEEETSMRPDIIDGFERKSVALLDYVNNLEAHLEQAKTSFENRESRLRADKKALEEEFAQRESKLKAEKRNLEEKLSHVLEQLSRSHKSLVHEERKRHAQDEAMRTLKQDVRASQDLLHNERLRSKELEQEVADVKEQLRNREHAYNKRRLKDERERAKLEEELATLRKKVTLGWILGCLSEVYLRLENESEPEKGVRVVSQLFEDDGKPAKLEAIEREVRRLITSQSIGRHQKHPGMSPRRAREADAVSESEVDLDLGSPATSTTTHESCRPCRYLRSAMESEHEHHYHALEARSGSPTALQD